MKGRRVEGHGGAGATSWRRRVEQGLRPRVSAFVSRVGYILRRRVSAACPLCGRVTQTNKKRRLGRSIRVALIVYNHLFPEEAGLLSQGQSLFPHGKNWVC